MVSLKLRGFDFKKIDEIQKGIAIKPQCPQKEKQKKTRKRKRHRNSQCSDKAQKILN